jgi:hypothetical protein
LRLTITGLLGLLSLMLLGCPLGRGGGFGGDDDDAATEDDDDAVQDDDDASGACADYRTVYPDGPYGTSQGSVLADFPDMQTGDGVTHTLFELYQDTSVAALVIVNAFDT